MHNCSARFKTMLNGALVVLIGCASCAVADKPPFKVLFNNDCTNLLTCYSPFHRQGMSPKPDDIPAMIAASVDEVADHGVDAIMFSPGMGWIPWWPSKVYPDHYQWYEQRMEKMGYRLWYTLFDHFVMAGGDVVAPFVARCREKGVAPFISFRLNDGHHLENDKRAYICKFYEQYPEYRIGPDRQDWNQHVQNWAIPAVRRYKFELLTELCTNYDIAGLELDFLRHASYFRLDETTAKQRCDIMAAFVADVRGLLDRTTPSGHRRYLCIRVPHKIDRMDRLGIDLPRFVAAGVDMVNLSPSYVMRQNIDVATVRPLVPDAALYCELEFLTQMWPLVKGYDGSGFRRASDEQLFTTAHLAYQHGADGISLFNFAYFRPFGLNQELRGPFNEPPFHVLDLLSRPEQLAQQDHCYFLDVKDRFPPGHENTYRLNISLVAPTADVSPPATLRLKLLLPDEPEDPRNDTPMLTSFDTARQNSRWRIILNGHSLEASDAIGEPYRTPYQAGLGLPKQYRAWAIRREHLQDGVNVVTVKHRESNDSHTFRLRWLEVSIPTQSQ